MIRKIAVVLHHHDQSFETTHYFLKLVIQAWEGLGIRVVIVRGIDRRISADAVFPHLDFTVTPPDYQAFFDHYPLVVNRDLNDISKRHVSRQLLTSESDYPGQVIVKTNLNSCGHSEKIANSLRELIKLGVPKFLRKPLKGQVPWRFRKALDSYPVFERIKDVPKGVFENPHLVVERFLPEMEGELYVLRNWMFLYGAGKSTKIHSFAPIVKAANSFRFEEAPVPAELAQMRRDLRADYGKFDYVIHNGQVVLYDVNKTPTLRTGAPSPRARAMAAQMAQALLAAHAELSL